MTDYKEMYMVLVDGICKAIECTMATDNPMVYYHLKKALADAEEIYINTSDDEEE